MQSGLIVVGGGELARVIIETAQLAKQVVVGFVDPLPCEETSSRTGVRHLGGDRSLSDYPSAKLILGVGSIKVSSARENIVKSMNGARWSSMIHPSAQVSETAIIEDGAIILAGAVVCSGAKIGKHCIVNIGAMIDHDVIVGDFVHVAPRAALGGASSVGAGSYIGMGACIRDHTIINENTMVGMGAVVAKEYPAGSVLVGVPARPI